MEFCDDKFFASEDTGCADRALWFVSLLGWSLNVRVFSLQASGNITSHIVLLSLEMRETQNMDMVLASLKRDAFLTVQQECPHFGSCEILEGTFGPERACSVPLCAQVEGQHMHCDDSC